MTDAGRPPSSSAAPAAPEASTAPEAQPAPWVPDTAPAHGLAALRKRWPLGTEFALFCLVGLLGLGVDASFFVPLVLGEVLDPRLAALVGYLAATIFSYLLNLRLTFGHRRPRASVAALGVYLLVGLVGSGVRVGVMQIFLLALGWSRPPEVYWSTLLGTVVATLVTYSGARFLVFGSRPAQGPAASAPPGRGRDPKPDRGAHQ